MICECYEREKEEHDDWVRDLCRGVLLTLNLNSGAACAPMRHHILSELFASLAFAQGVREGRIDPEEKLDFESAILSIDAELDKIVTDAKTRAREIIFRNMGEKKNGVRH